MIDDKDQKILKELSMDARLSSQDISKRTGIPTTTVFNRIKKMEQDKIIRGYRVVTDKRKTDRTFSAYVLLTCNYVKSKISQNIIAAELRKHKNVEEVAIVTGTNDIIVKVSTSSTGELNTFLTEYLRNMNGVDKTQTSIVLENF